MNQKKDTYTETDIEGISLEKASLYVARMFFTELSAEKIQLILKGIDTIEKDFYERGFEGKSK